MTTVNNTNGTAQAVFDQMDAFQSNAKPADVRSWYEAMANAWGDVLDGQAKEVITLANDVAVNGQDNPSTMTLLTASSMRMQFISQNASTSMSSVGQALETLARK